MIPRLVPKISPLDAFCDVVAAVVVGIGDSRSWMITFPSSPSMPRMPTPLLMDGNYFDNRANKDLHEKISMSNGKSVPLEIPCH